MYLSSVLMLLSWPMVILLSWYLVRLAVHFYGKARGKALRKPEM